MQALFQFYVTTTKGKDTLKSILIENDSELVEIHLTETKKVFLEVDDLSELIRILTDIRDDMIKVEECN